MTGAARPPRGRGAGAARRRGAGGEWPSDVSSPREYDGSGDGGAGASWAEGPSVEGGRSIRGTNSAGSDSATVASQGATVGMDPGLPPSDLASSAGSDPGGPGAIGREERSVADAVRVGLSGEGWPSEESIASTDRLPGSTAPAPAGQRVRHAVTHPGEKIYQGQSTPLARHGPDMQHRLSHLWMV